MSRHYVHVWGRKRRGPPPAVALFASFPRHAHNAGTMYQHRVLSGEQLPCAPPRASCSRIHGELHFLWLPSILPPSLSIMLTGYFRTVHANSCQMADIFITFWYSGDVTITSRDVMVTSPEYQNVIKMSAIWQELACTVRK